MQTMIVSNLSDDDVKMRIESIIRMLMEVASGNFNCKIERSDRDDELEGLVVVVNMMAEEMKASFMHRDYLNLNEADKNVPGMTFVLDNDLTIQTFNPHVMLTLFFTSQEIEGRPLENFLTSESRIVWESLKPRLAWQDDSRFMVELCFKTKRNLVFPSYCSVSTLFNAPTHQRKILITAIETILHTKEAVEGSGNALEYPETYSSLESNLVVDRHARRSAYFREADLLKIREVWYMLQNLQSPCSLSLLADKVGMEKRTLTKMFRTRYGKTVMAFVLEERMKKAVAWVQHSDMQLKEIALAIGYKDLSAFSKVFKKRFGHSPKVLRQRNLPEDSDILE